MKADLERKYYAKNKGLNVATEEIKQTVKAKATKLHNSDEKNNQVVQNSLFQSNEKLLFQKITGKKLAKYVKPDPEESGKFCNGILSQNVEHNETAEWIN